MTLSFSFIIAMFVTMVLIPPLMKISGWAGLLDFPGERKIHGHAIPRVGGVAMVIGSVIPLFIWLSPDNEVLSYLAGVAIIIIFGVWDDLKNLDYRLKFLGQILAALVVIYYGKVQITLLPFFEPGVLPEYVSILVTLFVLVGITNAINLADGLDGLAGGTTLLSMGAIAILAFIADGVTVVVMALAVMGGILGFLRFNTYPARVFMGDSGSQFLGFSAGILVILLSQKVNTAISPVLPVIILGLPILDTIMVIGQRVYEGRSPFKADKNHIHHKLLALGFDHYESVSIIYFTQACLVVGAYFLRYQSDLLILLSYLIFCVVVVGFLHWGKNSKRMTLRRNDADSQSFITKRINWLRNIGLIHKLAFYFTLLTITSYFLTGVLAISEVSPDITFVAVLLLFAAILTYVWHHHKPISWIEIGITFISSILIIYQMQIASGVIEWVRYYHDLYFVVLAVVVIIGFRFSKDKRFVLNPLDFLIVFLALVVPNIPSLPFADVNIGVTIGKMIVLFYGIVLVLNSIEDRQDIIRLGMIIILALLSTRGLLSL